MARTTKAELKIKQIRALKLLAAGATYSGIADDLGYANRGSAWRLVQRALEERVDDQVAVYRAVEQDRLDHLVRALWPAAVASGDPVGAAALVRVIEQRCRLLGLAASQPGSNRSIGNQNGNAAPLQTGA